MCATRGDADTHPVGPFILNVWFIAILAIVVLGSSIHAADTLGKSVRPPKVGKDEPIIVARLATQRDRPAEAVPMPVAIPAVSGDPSSEEQPSAPQTFGEQIDGFHDHTCLMTHALFDRIDKWFSAPGNESLPEVTCPFFVGFEDEILNRGNGIESLYNVKFDMKLRLPNMERRLNLFITTESLDEFVSTTPNEVKPVTDDMKHEFLAGFRRQLDDLFDVAVGVRSINEPELFGALKCSHTWHPGDWTVRPSAKGYWTTKEGLGASGGLLVERWWGPWLFRSASGAKRGEKTEGTEWSENVTFGYAQEMIQDTRFGSLAQARDFGRGVGFNGLVRGHGTETDAYEANVFYRRPLRGKWMYLHVAPEVRWTAERDWAVDYGVRLGLDFVFSTLCGE